MYLHPYTASIIFLNNYTHVEQIDNLFSIWQHMPSPFFFLEYEHEIIKPFNKFRQCTSKPYASWTFQWLQRDKRLRNMMVSEESCTMFGSSSVNHYCGQSHKQMHTWSQHLVGTTQPNKHLRMTNYESFQVIWCFFVSDESRPVAACPNKTQLMMSMPISLKNAML